ncbi:MAG: hypothetical protein Q9191_002669 [Dirinaria sp. TL-2023a]
MKIIIVGGGISGLSTYIFLKKLLPPALPHDTSLQICVCESHEAPRRQHRSKSSVTAPASFAQGVGGALGIAPNGLRVLKTLDQDLFDDVINQAYSVSKFRLQSRQGWSLADFPMTDAGEPPLHTILTSRQGIWDCLRDRVPDEDVVCKTVIQVIPGNGSQRPRACFAEGSPDLEADFIVGADGVRSVVKNAITGDGKDDALPAVYEGLVGVGGFIPASYLSSDEPPNTTTMTFGYNGFFGYGACSASALSTSNAVSVCASGSQAVWWSTYSLPSLPSSDNFDKVAICNDLQSRYAGWKDPTIQRIVSGVTVDSIYPTWTTPDLPTWEAPGLVLVGDAAHALQTSSGQGTSQALEDAQALSMFLAENLRHAQSHPRRQDELLQMAFKSYCTVRMPRAKRIADHAKQMGDMKREKGILAEYIMYLFIWIKGLFFNFISKSLRIFSTNLHSR